MFICILFHTSAHISSNEKSREKDELNVIVQSTLFYVHIMIKKQDSKRDTIFV